MRTTLRQNNIKLSTHNTKQNENDITMYKIINDIKYIYTKFLPENAELHEFTQWNALQDFL